MPVNRLTYREALTWATAGIAAMTASVFAALFALDRLASWLGVEVTLTARNIVLAVAILWPYVVIAGKVARRANEGKSKSKEAKPMSRREKVGLLIVIAVVAAAIAFTSLTGIGVRQ